MIRLLAVNRLPGLIGALMLAFSTAAYAAKLEPQTVDEWNAYLRTVQAQMDRRVSGQAPFLWLDSLPDGRSRARNGEIIVAPFDEDTPTHIYGGLVHHWIGAAFIPGARMKDTLGVVRDYPRYKDVYKPTVIDSSLDAETRSQTSKDDRFILRLRNQSLISKTALDVTYAATYVQVDAHRCYAVSRTTRLQEIDHYTEASQRTLPPGEGDGYIWRLYTTTRFIERDGGVYIEVEPIALSRDIPAAVRWFVEPIVRRVSRDALNTSLMQTADAVHLRLGQQSKDAEQTSPVSPSIRNGFLPDR